VIRGGCSLIELQIDGALRPASCLGIIRQTPEDPPVSALLKDVILTNAGEHGLRCNEAITTILRNVECVANARAGILIIQGSSTILLLGCLIRDNGDRGIQIVGGSTYTLIGCRFLNNRHLPPPFSDPELEGNAVDLRGAGQVQVIGCQFLRTVQLSGAAPKQYIFTDTARAPIVSGCWFDGGPDDPSQFHRAARFRDSSHAQFSNSVATRMIAGVVEFVTTVPPTITTSEDGVELCNRELGLAQPRIEATDTRRLFSLSRGTVGSCAWPSLDPADPRFLQWTSGSLAWDQSSGSLKVM